MNLFHRLIIKYFMTPKTFSYYLLHADESEAFGEVSKKACGINLGQFNMFTKSQLEVVLKVLGDEDTVLDVGCGNGRIARYIFDKVGCRVKGIDFAVDAINRANAKYGGSNISFEVRDIRSLDCTKEKYSRIICIDSLYFFPDITPVSESLIRLLHPGGKLIIFFTYNSNYHGKNGDHLIENSFSGSDVTITKTDFTENAIEMWRIMKSELALRKNKFIQEGNTALYRLKSAEAKNYLKLAGCGKIRRIIYEVNKTE